MSPFPKPCADPDLVTRRVLVPPGARVSIPSLHEQYHLRIAIDDPRTEPRLTLPLPKEGNPTKSRMPKPNDRDRLLLTVKFLYNNIPVEAVVTRRPRRSPALSSLAAIPRPNPLRAMTSRNASTIGGAC